MIPEIKGVEEFAEKKHETTILFYFSHDDCNVCKVLKPKVYELLKQDFPKMRMYYINIHKAPALAGQESVFTVPTILVYFDGKETYRRSRNIGIGELRALISRPYHLYYNEG